VPDAAATSGEQRARAFLRAYGRAFGVEIHQHVQVTRSGTGWGSSMCTFARTCMSPRSRPAADPAPGREVVAVNAHTLSGFEGLSVVPTVTG
jgi:hypothetical protein